MDIYMCICNHEIELALLQKHWDVLTNEQRSEVLDDLEECSCISTDILDDLSMRFETPCIPDYNRPNIGLCLEVLEKMTPTELQALETYIVCTVDDLKAHMNDGNVLFFLLQNYLVSNFTLHLPPLEERALPDGYVIPIKLRRKARAQRRKLNPTHSVNCIIRP